MKNMRSHLALVSLLVMFVGAGALVQDKDTAFTPSIWGIEMPVTDVDRAVSYYTEVLGFNVVQSPGSQRRVVLDNDGLKLIFRLTENFARPDDAAQLNLNLRVADLDQAARSVCETGGSLESSEPIIAAIGKFIPTLDPFGNSVHLIDLNGEENDPDGLPRLYNVGFTILDMDTSEAFFTSLGFEVYSRDYLPDTLPLKPVGAAMLVLHPLALKEANRNLPGTGLLLDCENLKFAAKFLRQLRLAFQPGENSDPEANRSLTLHDPSGNMIRIMKPTSILAVASAVTSATTGKLPIDSR